MSRAAGEEIPLDTRPSTLACLRCPIFHGWDRVDPATKNKVPNENEFDADLQWRPTWSFLRGFSARLRYARVHQYQGPRDTLNEYRAIFNYDFGLL